MTVHKGAMRVVGIDPGPVVGIVGIHIENGSRVNGWAALDVVQCDPGSLEAILDGLYRSYQFAVLIAVEPFVVGPRAARSHTPSAGQTTREVHALVRRWAIREDISGCVERRAIDVKPWATDARLDAAGLLAPTKGMRHARDAARHALFAAVKDCGVPDPLSTRAERHNHITRDIKPRGVCPGCDRYHDGAGAA